MHPSNVVLLLLAAAAAPAFATPIYACSAPAITPTSADVAHLATRDPNILSTIWKVLNLRSDNGGAPLAMRDVDVAELLSGRDGQDELLDARGLGNLLGNLEGKILQLRDIASEGLAARDLNDQLNALLLSRDVSPEQLVSLIMSRSFDDLD